MGSLLKNILSLFQVTFLYVFSLRRRICSIVEQFFHRNDSVLKWVGLLMNYLLFPTETSHTARSW